MSKIGRRMSLLTYKKAGSATDRTELFGGMELSTHLHSLPPIAENRRWQREGSEHCVDRVLQSQRLLSDYVATYKFDDPQWRSLLNR